MSTVKKITTASPRFSLKNKVAVITGGAGLLGSAFANGLAHAGAYVYVADVNVSRARVVVDQLAKAGKKANHVELDISSVNSIVSCLNRVVHESGHVDIWVNNAYPRTNDWNLRFEKIPEKSWRLNVDEHLNGYCLCCQKVAEQMKRRRTGSIINLASIYGIVGPNFDVYEGTSMTVAAAYSAIKGGIINFTRYLAAYYGPYGVRVNSISPGGVFNHQPASFVKRYTKKTPLRRMARPDDIVGPLLFLASDASSYVTGHNLVVDGGWTIV